MQFDSQGLGPGPASYDLKVEDSSMEPENRFNQFQAEMNSGAATLSYDS